MSRTSVQWEVTNRCNLHCKHCIPESGKPRPNELTTEEALQALRTFREAGAELIRFTGGEAFTRPDFTQLLRATAELGMEASVITNGTLLSDELLAEIGPYVLELGVSLDGATSVSNDTVRGRGVYDKVIASLRRCAEHGIPTRLQVTVNRQNLSDLEQLATIAAEYCPLGILFSEMNVAGRAVAHADELVVIETEAARLPERVARITRQVFGEELSALDEDCWVSEETIFMSAEGNLYSCIEIFQRRPDLTLGNIRGFDLARWQRESSGRFAHKAKCCYGVAVSDRVVLITNISSICAFSPPQRPQLATLAQLQSAVDALYPDIVADCRECQDPDCMGYIWLLEQEAERLEKRGIPLVQINDGPTFLHSFPIGEDGVPDLTARYPSCHYLCSDGSCGIHADRPFLCHLYPLGLETLEDGTVAWVIHRDCQHVRRLYKQAELADLANRARSVIDSIAPDLLSEILLAYRAVDELTSYPDGGNDYFVIKEVRD